MNDKSIVLSVERISHHKVLYMVIKRLFDIIISGVALLISWPILLVVSVVIKLDSEGPAIFKQKRIGKNGEDIYIYKFRTMVLNADEILFRMLETNEEMAEEYKINKKLHNDPRITKVGKVIRKLSIDELPQLINIFKGDMTLVGPRPYLHREIEDMGNYYDEIIKMTPGLTGYWQVNGRSNTTFKERLKLDKEYLNIRNIKEDTKILFKTFKIVFQRDGAE